MFSTPTNNPFSAARKRALALFATSLVALSSLAAPAAQAEVAGLTFTDIYTTTLSASEIDPFLTPIGRVELFLTGSPTGDYVGRVDATGPAPLSTDVSSKFDVNDSYLVYLTTSDIEPGDYQLTVVYENPSFDSAATPTLSPSYSTQLTVTISDGVLPGIVSTQVAVSGGASVGQTIYASAVERYFSNQAYDTPAGDGPNEYAYRITTTPNVSSTSIDAQPLTGYPHGDYEMMLEGEQGDWYDNTDLFPNGYVFSWWAFVCMDNQSNVVAATNLSVEQSSLPDAFNTTATPWVPNDDDVADLRGLVFDRYTSNLSPAVTMVGTQRNDIPGNWGFSPFVPFGVSEVTGGNCAAGSELTAVQIYEEQDPPVLFPFATSAVSYSKIETKAFTVPESLIVWANGNPVTLDSTNVTIGVTGGGGVAIEFDAALWGITTISPAATEAAIPSPYAGPVVTTVSDAAAGESVSVTGVGLNQVSAVEVDGNVISVSGASQASFSFVLPEGITAGVKDLKLIGSFGSLVAQAAFTVTGAAAPGEAVASWTKLQADGNSVKLYGKNLVGQGKVQFMLGGKEIAWVRAIDAADPKLSFANGFSYLVRTVDLAPGKNRFEILVDGERVFRATYVPKG